MAWVFLRLSGVSGVRASTVDEVVEASPSRTRYGNASILKAHSKFSTEHSGKLGDTQVIPG